MVYIHKLHFVPPAKKNSLVETGVTLYHQQTLIIKAWRNFVPPHGVTLYH